MAFVNNSITTEYEVPLMADRIVKVTLSAQVQQYKTAMLDAAQATRLVGTESQKLAATKQAFEQLGRTAMTAGGLIGAGAAFAVKRWADFDQAVSNVAATGEDARRSLQALRDAAIDAGAKTVFSATESANAIEEMAKAGVNAADILGGGLTGALDLAAAGGLGVADAAGIAATALKIFNLEGSDMSHVADLLAAGAGKAMGDVSDLSQALAQGGQVAAATGLSIEETTAALSAFASQGLLGSDAGTSFKTMLQSLTPQSKEARDQFEALGISAYDANGEFVGLADFAGQLQTALSDLTPEQRNAALAVMFGSDAVRAANVLYSEGETGIRKWTAAVDDQGYAAETARTRLDNLKGDIEALGGAIDSAFITMGEAADGPLRSFVQGLTGLVDGFNELPDGAKDAAFWIGAASAAALTAGGVYLSAVPKLAEYQANLKTLGVTASRTTKIVGVASAGLSVALLGTTAVLGALASAQAGARARSEELADSLDQVTGAATSATRGVVADLLTRKGEGLFGVETSSIQDWGNQLGVTLTEATDVVLDNGNAFDQMSVFYRAAEGDAAALQVVMDRTGLTADVAKDRAVQFTRGLDQLRSNAASAKDELKRQNDAQKEAGTTAKSAADAYIEQADAAVQLEDSLSDLLDRINEANGEQQDAVSSNAKWRQSLAGIKDQVDAAKDAYKEAHGSLKGFELSLDQNTAAGSANAAMLSDVAAAGQKSAEAQYDVDLKTMSADAATKKYNDTLKRQRDAFEKTAVKAGFSKDAVKDLADQVFALPSKEEIEILAATARAETAIAKFVADASQKTIKIGVTTYSKNTDGGLSVKVDGVNRTAKADGGAIVGPGTSTSDSIPAWLSNGEHVIPADEVRAAGGQAAVYRWREAMARGDVPKFASGGAVTTEAWQEWQRIVRRGEARTSGMTGNGLDLVDRLFDVAAQIGGKYGKRLNAAAYASEKSFRSLEKQANQAATRLEKAKDKLADLKDAAADMASRVASAVRGLFNVGDLAITKTVSTASQSSVVGGVTVSSSGTTVENATTAKSISASMRATAGKIKAFADKLKRLAKKGFNGALLEEVAALGVEQGEPIVDALLEASKEEVASINRAYRGINKYSGEAGKTVADVNYEKLIDTAEKARDDAKADAEAIRKKLERETTRLIKGITDALKVGRVIKKAEGGPVYGPGTSTSDSVPAWLSNGEHIIPADEVDAMGGQAAVLRWRQMMSSAPQYSAGGAVSTLRYMTPTMPQYSHRSDSMEISTDSMREFAEVVAAKTAAAVRDGSYEGTSAVRDADWQAMKQARMRG